MNGYPRFGWVDILRFQHRAAIILLGKPSAEDKLSPAVAQITWTRRDKNEDLVDYEHFSIPFILTVDEVLAKIDNLTMREMPGGTLFPDTMKQYDNYTIREALHNSVLCKGLHKLCPIVTTTNREQP